MAKTGSVVASEPSSGSGRRNDVGAIDCRIAENWSVRERKWVSKTFGNNGGRKVNSLFGFRESLHPWRCSGRFEDYHP